MKKKKPLDRLTIESTLAIEAGMSYGKWKAMQQPEKVVKKMPESWKVCQHCGERFKPNRSDQKFCDIDCQRKAAYERSGQHKKVMKDLTGQKFGMLTALEITKKPEGSKRIRTYWLCKCECGNTALVRSDNLTQGRKKSCGCLRRSGKNGQA